MKGLKLPPGWEYHEQNPKFRNVQVSRDDKSWPSGGDHARAGQYFVRPDAIAAMLKMTPKVAEDWIAEGRYEDTKDVKMARLILQKKWPWYRQKLLDDTREKL